MSNFTKILLVFIVVGVIAGIVTAFQRNSVEQSNKKVEIVMDYNAFSDMVKTEGAEEIMLLKFFQEAGLTSLSISEDTIEKLKQNGIVNWYMGSDFPSAKNRTGLSMEPDKLYLTVNNADTVEQLVLFLPMFSPSSTLLYMPDKNSISVKNPAVFEFSMPEKSLLSLGLGFSYKKIAKYKEMGLNVIIRPENKSNLSPGLIEEYFKTISNISKPDGIIFAGPDNDVIGYPGYLSETSKQIEEFKIPFGIIEAPNPKAMQKGIQTVSQKCPLLGIRLITIPPLQQQKSTIEDMVAKYSLGMRERNIRMIYIRPHTILENNQDILQTNMAYISAIKDTVTKNKLETGKAKPFKAYTPAAVLLILMGLGAISIFILILEKFELSDPLLVLIGIIWLIATIICFWKGQAVQWCKICSLIAAVSTPIAAIWFHFDEIRDMMYRMEYPEALKRGSLALVKIFALCFAGGLITAGLLSSNAFLIQADQFRGIKLLMVIPALVLTLLWVGDSKKLIPYFNELLQKSVAFMHLLIIGILGGAGAYYILRSGNSGDWAVSGTEMSVRNLLNKVLAVRPRFKEFLLGFPAMMLFPALHVLKLEKYDWLLIAIAAIGFSDILDTFAHLHTPIGITVIRLLIGLILGWLTGAILLGAVYIYDKRKN